MPAGWQRLERRVCLHTLDEIETLKSWTAGAFPVTEHLQNTYQRFCSTYDVVWGFGYFIECCLGCRSEISFPMTFSGERLGVAEYFEKYEGLIRDWTSSAKLISDVIDSNNRHGARVIVWRGLTDWNFWPDNSLYRHLQKRNQYLSGTEAGRPPFEGDLVNFEMKLLEQARMKWRFDHYTALEIFARVRHYGGPTRLLDVTFNPLIALWFAVEKQFDEAGREKPDIDGRLFAFDVTNDDILLDNDWGGRDLPWDPETDTKKRQFGEPQPRWVWKPPSYNDRIPAQNSAFLIGQVPSESELQWKYSVDSPFRLRLASAPGLISQATERVLMLKESLNELSVIQNLKKNFRIVQNLVSDFTELQKIGEEIDGVTMALQEIEARETGVIFTPRLLSEYVQPEFWSSMQGEEMVVEVREEQSDVEEISDAEFLDEYRQYASELMESCDISLNDLAEYGDAIKKTEDWFLSRSASYEFSSVAMEMTKLNDESPPGSFATYTIRITAEAKAEIREILERSYGYNASTLYPDIMGLAEKGVNLMS